MEEKLYGAWLLELSTYFIRQQKYQLVTMSENNDEVWLVNTRNKELPILMISSNPTQNFDFKRIDAQRNTLASLFNTSANGLNISINPLSEEFSANTVGVNPSFQSSSDMLDIFQGVGSVLKVSNNPDIHLAKAVLSFKKTLSKSQIKVRKKTPATLVLCLVSIVVSLLGMGFYYLYPNYSLTYIALGGFYKPLIVEGYEIWRFITSAFVNIDIFELLLSLLVLRNAGRLLEPLLGWKRYLLIFLSGIFFGNLVLYITNEVTISVGVITGICALLGYLLVYGYEVKVYRNSQIMGHILNLAFVTVLYVGLPTVSKLSMFAALYLGILYGFYFSKKPGNEQIKNILKYAIPFFIVVVCFIAYSRPWYEINEPLNHALVDIFNDLKLTPYAQRLQSLFK